ncbi:MAG: hypothetical protein EZS28_008772, partial [Streblomastix strix]
HAQVGLLEVVRILLENGVICPGMFNLIYFLEFIVEQDNIRKQQGDKSKDKEEKKEEKKEDLKISKKSLGKGSQPSAGRFDKYNKHISKGANQVALKARVILGLANQLDLKSEEKQFKERYKRKTEEFEASLQQQIGEIDFKFAPGTTVNYVTVSGKKCTLTSNTYKTVCLEPPVVASGSGPIVRCEITFDYVQNYCGFGLIMTGFGVLDGNQAYEASPYYTYTMTYHQNGNIYRNGNNWGDTSGFSSGQRLAIEVDMSKQPHVAYFFVNDALQGGYMLGIPDNVKFFACFYNKNDAFTVTSMKKLPRPSITDLSGKTARYW